METTLMVSNLVILANSFDTTGNGDLPFPHAWAALIWFSVTASLLISVMWPWLEWDSQIDRYPVTDRQKERNAKYRRKINILLGTSFLISVLAAVIPLCMGL